jgi:phenylacetate-CoA ligase
VGGPPRRVVTPRSALAGIGWPAVPPTMESAVLALNYQFEQSQWWPPGTIEALQLRQAEQLLAHAWRTVPFYRDRLAPLTGLKRGQLTMEAWRRIPILTRTDIQDAGHDLVSRALPRGHGTARDASTSGSTGQPVWFKRTRVTGLFFAALNLRYHLWHGRDFSAKSAKIGRLSDPNAVEEPHNWVPGHVSGPMVQLDFSKSVEEQLAWLQRFAPQYLLTFPSNLRALLQGSVETGINIPSLREVATMSEVLEPDLRVKCRRIWGLPVTDVYSAHEVGMIAIQCPEHPHYHVQAESVLVEVLNDHGEPCRPGESGRVVVTDLHNFSSPLIRYDINDIAIPGGPCSCGRGLAVIKSILGRIRNALTLPSGEKVWPAYHFIFDDALGKSLPSLREAQLVQRKLDEIEVRIVATRPVTAEEEARARKALGKAISDAFAFRFVYVDDLPRPPSGKLQVVLSELGD